MAKSIRIPQVYDLLCMSEEELRALRTRACALACAANAARLVQYDAAQGRFRGIGDSDILDVLIYLHEAVDAAESTRLEN